MDFRQLKCFVEIATMGSISEAANSLNRSQPGVSRHIQLLEHDLDAKLFQRTARGMTLTAAGEKLLPEARALILRAEKIRSDMKSGPSEMVGSCSIGTSQIFGPKIFGSIAARMKARHPRVHLRMEESHNYSQNSLIETLRLDMAIVFDPARRSGFNYLPLMQEGVFLALPAHDESLKGRSDCDIADLHGRSLALPAPGQSRRALINSICRQFGVELEATYEVSTMATALALTQTGLCCSLVTQATLESLRAGSASIRSVRVRNLAFTRYLVMDAEKAQLPIPRAASDIIVEVISEVAEHIPGAEFIPPSGLRGSTL